MASTATLKELAREIVARQDMPEPSARKIIERLSRAGLKQLLLYVRLEMRRHKVLVTTAENTGEPFRKHVESIYPGAETSFSVDASLGAGMRIEHGDDITDISVKGLLERAYQQIKERL